MKTIIVTGGAKGIGKAIVYELAKKNCDLILNYNTSEKEAFKIKKELNSKGFNVDIYKADVSKKTEVDKMINYAINKYKKIDVLINNAGISQIKPFADITEEDWNNMIRNKFNINLLYLQGCFE